MTYVPRRILQALKSEGLSPRLVLEVFQACVGDKVSRIALSDAAIPRLSAILDSHGLHAAYSMGKFYSVPDQGKAGWCNGTPLLLPATSPLGEHFIYVGRNPATVYRAMRAEEAGQDADIGDALGIPACCVAHYLKAGEEARTLQNDLTLASYRNTRTPLSLEPYTNTLSQYFGYGILGFFPCSFECEYASWVARRTMSTLAEVDPVFAAEFVKKQSGIYLYTEFEGIHRIGAWERSGDGLTYDARTVEGTVDGVIGSCIRRGCAIETVGPHEFKVIGRDGVLVDFRHPLTAMMVFERSWAT